MSYCLGLNWKHEQMKAEALETIIEILENGYSGYYCDLHSEAFNSDYYIVGTAKAKDALREYDVFDAIEVVQEYEKEQFGEVYTDLSNPEKLVNMLFYVIGDDIIGEMIENIEAFNNNWNSEADEETNAIIVEAIRKTSF